MIKFIILFSLSLSVYAENNKLEKEQMPEGHELRFMDKLDKALPEKPKSKFNFWQLAASVVILLGLSFGAYKYYNPTSIEEPNKQIVTTDKPNVKSLGDISPDLKKVEDYYLANINLELSKMTFTPENKELFDGYIERLEELNKEYDRLSVELTESGPNESTVDALINNLKLRLNLMYRLKEKLNELNNQNLSPQKIEA